MKNCKFTQCSALPFVELLHDLSLLCTFLGWQIFLVTECIELIIAEKISHFFRTEQSECHHHEGLASGLHAHALTAMRRTLPKGLMILFLPQVRTFLRWY
jgi:hypothetical protein